MKIFFSELLIHFGISVHSLGVINSLVSGYALTGESDFSLMEAFYALLLVVMVVDSCHSTGIFDSPR